MGSQTTKSPLYIHGGGGEVVFEVVLVVIQLSLMKSLMTSEHHDHVPNQRLDVTKIIVSQIDTTMNA
jgi:hypothetical protein